jgi:hypothetical protein
VVHEQPFAQVRKIREEEEAFAEKTREALAEGNAQPELPGGTMGFSMQLRAKEIEQRAKLREIALVYATILLKHSNYANTQQEREFFECLYDFSKRVLFTIKNRKLWHAIENELDRVFRSGYFNLSHHKNDAQQHAAEATTSFKVLFERSLSMDGIGRSANTNKKSNIHKALLMRSPIISEIFPTPKERAERAAQAAAELLELKQLQQESDSDHDAGTSQVPLRRTPSSRAEQSAHAGSRRDDTSARSMLLDGEAAMEALVNDTSRSFNEQVG